MDFPNAALGVSSSTRNIRHLPSSTPSLPRLRPMNKHDGPTEKYEVIIIGAGPAGQMLNLLLARYGLDHHSRLCIDSKSGTVKAGQADGLQPRTLEVFQSLGLADEILSQGCQMWEFAFWNPSTTHEDTIEQTSVVPVTEGIETRYPHEVSIHQGRIERILEENLSLYSRQGIEWGCKLLHVKMDESQDSQFPVVVEVEGKNGHRRTIRCKYLVGADGAHSTVRQSMGLQLKGDSLDSIWGVVDLVVESDFPDLRRPAAIHSATGSVMIIPREKIDSGESLTRLYVQIPGDIRLNGNHEAAKGWRKSVTLDHILGHAARALRPYTLQPKEGGAVDWWAVYQIGQRMVNQFSVKDSSGMDRVFIVGDACHTHSPKAGQGMNVSMMDSFNLAWKLLYAVNGITPDAARLLDTYHIERHTVARQLIDFDHAFSSVFSGKTTTTPENVPSHGLTSDQLREVYQAGIGFISGCGIEYPESLVVNKTSQASRIPIRGTNHLSGILCPGRRLANVVLKRYADGVPRNLHDEMPYDGRFRILVFTSNDLLDPRRTSALTLTTMGHSLLPTFPDTLVEQLVIHPTLNRRFTWLDIPLIVKHYSEMRLYHGIDQVDAYAMFGVDPTKGALVVVRPDGYVGVIAELVDVSRVAEYLVGCLGMKSGGSDGTKMPPRASL
ncbi:FAD binding domain-containing protein [Aspergillus bertholletiae]|uniref:FAD binding domain-containing protein n=1 Tax=Aspergillus bertholletiae TaxID=1226010 RepID=A0A5N7B7R0_9EURO|nr:FAD binding domain-containing protein [Aspergillus bertholletiae]